MPTAIAPTGATTIEEEIVDNYSTDPLDTEVVLVTLTAREVYTILDALYQDTLQEPDVVGDVVLYLENRVLDFGLPCSRDEFDSYHEENEQYHSIVLKK